MHPRRRLSWVVCGLAAASLYLSSCQTQNGKEAGGSRAPASANDDYWGSFDTNHEAESSPDPKVRDSILKGRAIWYKATAGNARFHEYTLPQRIAGARIDWYRFFRTDERGRRFTNWGLINDPDCCTPGRDCQTRGINVTMEQTFGLDYCKGDETLWPFVGREVVGGKKWATDVDPACSFDPSTGTAGKENSCALEFGQAMGAVGYRKFPNPRFDRNKWPGWDEYSKRLDDFSIEPPFRVGISCASCHVGLDPLHPAENPNLPRWANIRGDVGSQHTRIAELFASSFKPSDAEFQMFAHGRPGAVDTSGIPTDMINNPGTANAIINFDKRPRFTHDVKQWRQVAANRCPSQDNDQFMRIQANRSVDPQGQQRPVDPSQPYTCWEKSKQRQHDVLHVLKGGEDSVGPAGAVVRVYVNIGACSEQCWVNHLVDYRALNPALRNYGQTPFDVGQCRRDCPNYRAIEDRVGDVANFLFTRRPTDLVDAVKDKGALKEKSVAGQETGRSVQLNDFDDLSTYLEQRFGGTIARGEQVFRMECARCHSSQVGNNRSHFADSVNAADLRSVNFLAQDEKGVRIDWLGNDKLVPASVVGTYNCRARHTNHLGGHVWEEYASEDLRDRRPADNAPKGVGYYRNISLLSLWATAPYLHNNAAGPEVCGDPQKYPAPQPDFSKGPEQCRPFDPSIMGRISLFEASMRELLTPPEQRNLKTARTTEEIKFPLGMVIGSGQRGKANPVYLVFPKGIPVNMIGSFDLKRMAGDLVAAQKSGNVADFLKKKYGEQAGTRLAGLLGETVQAMTRALADRTGIIPINRDRLRLYNEFYGNCDWRQADNQGHSFGTTMPENDKKSLLAFLATL